MTPCSICLSLSDNSLNALQVRLCCCKWQKKIFLMTEHIVLVFHSCYCSTLWHPWTQHTRLLCPSLSPGVCSDSCLLSWWFCLLYHSILHIYICSLSIHLLMESNSWMLDPDFYSSAWCICLFLWKGNKILYVQTEIYNHPFWTKSSPRFHYL